MEKKEKYQIPEMEAILLSTGSSILNDISTKGFKEDDDFDPSGWGLA